MDWLVHAKAGVIDGRAWVGSANFDVRSMLLNFESALVLLDEASVSAVAGWYERLTEGAGTEMPEAGLMRRAGEGLFRLGTPLL